MIKRRTVLNGVGIAILVYAVFVSVAFGLTRLPAQTPSASTSANSLVVAQPKEPEVSDIDQMVLWKETNAHRAKNDLPPVALDARLNASALEKCKDMVSRNYWSHDAPDGTEPWAFIQRHVGGRYAAGENLSYGNNSAKKTINSWIASPTHNGNLLDARFTRVGFGVCKSSDFQDSGAEVITVQHFVKL